MRISIDGRQVFQSMQTQGKNDTEQDLREINSEVSKARKQAKSAYRAAKKIKQYADSKKENSQGEELGKWHDKQNANSGNGDFTDNSGIQTGSGQNALPRFSEESSGSGKNTTSGASTGSGIGGRISSGTSSAVETGTAIGTGGSEAAGVGAGAAAGAGTAGGTGAAAGTAVAGAAAAGGTAGFPVIIAIVIGAALFLLIVMFFLINMALLKKGSTSTGTRYQQSQIQQNEKKYSGEFEEGNNDNKPEDDPDYADLQEYDGRSPSMKSVIQFVVFFKGSNKYLNDIQGDDLLEDMTVDMEDVFEKEVSGVFEKAQKLALLDGEKWVDELGEANPHGHWTDESKELTMERVYAAVEALFTNVDYAELFDVVSMNENFDYDNMTEKQFRELFLGTVSTRTDVLRQYYYLNTKVDVSRIECKTRREWGRVHYWTDPITGERYDDGDELLEIGIVELEKYNLDELFAICYGSYTGEGKEGWGRHDSFNPDTQMKGTFRTMASFLDWQEKYTRRYTAWNTTSKEGKTPINKETAGKLFGVNQRSERGDVRPRKAYEVDFSYWISETMPDLWNWIHGFDDDSGNSGTYDTGGGYITNSKEKKILNMYRYINQGEEPQASLSFAGGTYRQYGCAPSCYIMVAEYYTRRTIDIGSAISKHSAGTAGIKGAELIAEYGGKQTQSGYSGPEQIIAEIDAGNPVVLSLRGYNSFHHTGSGHYVVIMGYDEDGFYMYDPGNRGNTYGYGTDTYTVSYEQFEADSSTFQSIYTFSFPNITISDSSGSISSFNVDSETATQVAQALAGNGYSNGANFGLVYAYLTEKYGSNFAIGFMANMMQESSGAAGVEQGGSVIFHSGADITRYMNSSSASNWKGLGICQWTEGRKLGLLNQYIEDGLDKKATVSQTDLLSSELKFLQKELTGSESGTVSACQGLSAVEVAEKFAATYERCGIYGERSTYASNFYSILQRNGIVE